MQSFLAALCIAILEKVLVKGTKAFDRYLELKNELENNKKAAADYDKVVKNPEATREDRRRAEDSALS